MSLPEDPTADAIEAEIRLIEKMSLEELRRQWSLDAGDRFAPGRDVLSIQWRLPTDVSAGRDWRGQLTDNEHVLRKPVRKPNPLLRGSAGP